MDSIDVMPLCDEIEMTPKYVRLRTARCLYWTQILCKVYFECSVVCSVECSKKYMTHNN